MTQLQGPEILAQYRELVSRAVLTFFRHMSPVSRSIPSTGFSGHYSQIIVAFKVVEAQDCQCFPTYLSQK